MIVLTMGTFDLFHNGHVELLRACSEMAGFGGRVIVAVNSDEFVERFKGKRPLMNLRQRRDILNMAAMIDAVLVNIGGEDAKPIIEAVMPDIIAIGDDWKTKDYLGQLGIDERYLRKHKIKIVYVPRTTGESSTNLRQRIAKG